MKTMKPIKPRSQAELRKHTPSALFRSALYRSGAGAHVDDRDRYGKRDRARNRADERTAALSSSPRRGEEESG